MASWMMRIAKACVRKKEDRFSGKQLSGTQVYWS